MLPFDIKRVICGSIEVYARRKKLKFVDYSVSLERNVSLLYSAAKCYCRILTKLTLTSYCFPI